MLGRGGQFRDVPCPFYTAGSCERPYCHYKHDKPPQGNVPQVTTCRSEDVSSADAGSMSLGTESTAVTSLVSGTGASFVGYMGFVGTAPITTQVSAATTTDTTEFDSSVATASVAVDDGSVTEAANEEGGPESMTGENDDTDIASDVQEESAVDKCSDTGNSEGAITGKSGVGMPTRRNGVASNKQPASPVVVDKTEQLNEYTRNIADIDRQIAQLQDTLKKSDTDTAENDSYAGMGLNDDQRKPIVPYKPTKISRDLKLKAPKYTPTPIAKLERRLKTEKPVAGDEITHTSSSSTKQKPVVTKSAPKTKTSSATVVEVKSKKLTKSSQPVDDSKSRKEKKSKLRERDSKSESVATASSGSSNSYQPKSAHLAAKLKAEKTSVKRRGAKKTTGDTAVVSASSTKLQTIDLFSVNIETQSSSDTETEDKSSLLLSPPVAGGPHDADTYTPMLLSPPGRVQPLSDDGPVEVTSPLADGKRVAHKTQHSNPRQDAQKRVQLPTAKQQLQMRYTNLKKAKEQLLLEASTGKRKTTASAILPSNAGAPIEKRTKHQTLCLQQPDEQTTHSASQLDVLIPLHRQGVAGIASTVPKGERRVAHVPKQTSSQPSAASSSSLPTATPLDGRGSKVPLDLRQRYLDMFIVETVKIVGNANDEAVSMAQQEEKSVISKSSTKGSYLSAAVTQLKRLRERVLFEDGGSSVTNDSASLSRHKSPPTANSVSHSAVLAGKGQNTFTMHRSRASSKPQSLSEVQFFGRLQKYLMTEQQMVDNGFPRLLQSGHATGEVTIQLTDKDGVKRHFTEDNDFNRICGRCGARYRLTSDGEYVNPVECIYHWGKAFQRKVPTGGIAHSYTCCNGDLSSRGCCDSPQHVTEQLTRSQRHLGYISTAVGHTTSTNLPGKAYALDCEMVYTVWGPALARISLVDFSLTTVLDVLVRPQHRLVDCNSRFSGLTKQYLDDPAVVSFDEAREKFLSLLNRNCILIGHSLESDLKSMKIVHDRVIDTSIVFPHNRGPPFKRALKTLMVEFCKKIIQDSADGHDSAEDARACMELMLYKIKNE